MLFLLLLNTELMSEYFLWPKESARYVYDQCVWCVNTHRLLRLLLMIIKVKRAFEKGCFKLLSCWTSHCPIFEHKACFSMKSETICSFLPFLMRLRNILTRHAIFPIYVSRTVVYNLTYYLNMLCSQLHFSYPFRRQNETSLLYECWKAWPTPWCYYLSWMFRRKFRAHQLLMLSNFANDFINWILFKEPSKFVTSYYKTTTTTYTYCHIYYLLYFRQISINRKLFLFFSLPLCLLLSSYTKILLTNLLGVTTVKESDSDTIIMVIVLVAGVGGVFILFALMALCYRWVGVASKVEPRPPSLLRMHIYVCKTSYLLSRFISLHTHFVLIHFS